MPSGTPDSEVFVRELTQSVSQHGDALMTIAQQLEQKGIEKGHMEEREEGKLEAPLKIARTMLKNGLDYTSIMKITGLTTEDLDQIRH
ncbi:Rpn family recombination-promoting nuclease/putative transposase [Salmonella enterica]|nr:Rpn family recombination-promoting nuclease/putative transposase [Salmonella enterica]EHZ8363788.1 Rpn family recombination-promoting nuclease/putative transposase [Salmonella enterica]